MKKLFLVFCVSLFALSACKNNDLPEHILSQEKMLPIMVDLHIAEETIDVRNLNFDSSRVLYHSVYKPAVLKKHNVKLADFDSSFVYYERNIEHMNDLYQRVIDTLSLRYSIKKIQ